MIMSPTPANLLFVLELQIRALRVRARLNEIPVFEGSAEERKIVQVKLNPFVVEGRNLLALELAGAPGDRPALKLTVFRGEHGQEPGPDGTLASFATEQPGGATIAEVWRTEFNAQPAFGRWAWQDAPDGALAEGDFAAIRSLVGETAAAFRSRDTAALTGILAIKNSELPRALGVDPDGFAQSQTAFWNGLFSSPEWSVPAPNLERLRITPQAGGRLATVTAADGDPPISGAAGERRFLMPVMVGRIAGQWRIVR
jgi:hypothetical protein